MLEDNTILFLKKNKVIATRTPAGALFSGDIRNLEPTKTPKIDVDIEGDDFGDELAEYGDGGGFDDPKKLVKGLGKIKIITKLDALGDLIHAKKLINRLSDIADAKLLERIGNLSNLQLQKLDELYNPKNFQLPSYRPSINGKKLGGDFTVKTRDGKHIIYFDTYGFPDLKKYSLGDDFTYSFKLVGNSKDFSKATKWLKEKYKNSSKVNIKRNTTNLDITIEGENKTYTWHHHQNGKDLVLVETIVHKNIVHIGGAAIIKRYLQGLFK